MIQIYIFSIQFEYLMIMEMFSVSKFVFIIVLLLYIINIIADLIIKKGKIIYNIFNSIAVLLLLTLVSINSVISQNLMLSLERDKIIFQLGVSTFIISNFLISYNIDDIEKAIIKPYMFSSITVCSIALYLGISKGTIFINRLNTFNSPGEEAHFAAALVPSIIYIYYIIFKKKDYKYILLLLILFFSLLFSQTRSAWTAFILISLFFIAKYMNIKKGLIVITVSLIAILILEKYVDISIIQNIINNRIQNGIDTGGSGRKEIWIDGIKLFKEKPILGYGIGTFPYVFQRKYIPDGNFLRGEFRAPHNIYLSILVEFGLIGLIVIVLIFIYYLLKIKNIYMKNSFDLKEFFYLNLMSYSAIGFFLDILYRKYFWYIFIILIYIKKRNK
jgi:O-antigen ligase